MLRSDCGATDIGRDQADPSLSSQPWQLLSFQATLLSGGMARFGVRVDNADPASSGGACAIQMRVLAGFSAEQEGGSIAIAPVGVDLNVV